MSTTDDLLEATSPRREPLADGSELFSARISKVGGLEVRRLLPQRERRSVGGWCFLDHYGPLSVDGTVNMTVAPHPHIGLQTITWLFSGEVAHHDSLGNEQLIRPGELNLMTAGHGIAHAEVSRHEHDRELHGVQLWLAMPEASRDGEPDFAHLVDLPELEIGGAHIQVFAGSLSGTTSPARTYSAVVGAEITKGAHRSGEIDLDPAFEHLVAVVAGRAALDRRGLGPSEMAYLAPGTSSLELDLEEDARVVLLGGPPFAEPLLLWWNFVARTNEEVVAASAAWEAGDRFGTVAGFRGERLHAPPVPPHGLLAR